MSKPSPTKDPDTNDTAAASSSSSSGATILSDGKKQEMAAAFAAAMTNVNGNDQSLLNQEQDGDAEHAADVAAISSQPLTYANSKQSPFYLKAKEAMKMGDFEAALEKIVSGITTILSLLPPEEDNDNNNNTQGQNELHEAIAPLYYLYGTTLLYSVEESQDSAEAAVMAQQGMTGDADAAGDLQIAWENLESARSIVSKMNMMNHSDSPEQGELDEETKNLALDLAQIHSRLGDLSRHDGHYQQAIRDYEACCQGRRKVLTDHIWDRRIADVEYALGMTNILLAAEGEKKLLDKDADNNDAATRSNLSNNPVASAMSAAATAGVDNADDEKVNLSPKEITALRERSLCHYVQCARILAGIIGSMTGKDPSELAAADESLEAMCSIGDGDKKCAAKPPTSLKTTGLDDEEESSDNHSVQEKASKAISAIRDRVSDLKPSDVSDKDVIDDLREMLDEIQETIDNCETDREGLRDVNMMRKKAEEDAKKEDAMDESNVKTTTENGEMTTIGFGSSPTTATAAASVSSSIGFKTSSTSDVNTTSATKPMMVVKKKKKAATLEQVDVKKAKTSE